MGVRDVCDIIRLMDECLIPIKIEPLKEGGFLATSSVLQGLVAQGRTIAETMEIAQDVARKLIESCHEHGDPVPVGLFRRNGKKRNGKNGGVRLTIPVAAVR